MNLSRNRAALAAVVLLLAATGCAEETTSKTEADVTQAETTGAEAVADANHSLAIAEAQAAHKVAIEQCEAQSGEARATCKGLADVTLDNATARANAVKAAAYPNG